MIHIFFEYDERLNSTLLLDLSWSFLLVLSIALCQYVNWIVFLCYSILVLLVAILDAEEFGEAAEAEYYDENSTKSAEELGLMVGNLLCSVTLCIFLPTCYAQ